MSEEALLSPSSKFSGSTSILSTILGRNEIEFQLIDNFVPDYLIGPMRVNWPGNDVVEGIIRYAEECNLNHQQLSAMLVAAKSELDKIRANVLSAKADSDKPHVVAVVDSQAKLKRRLKATKSDLSKANEKKQKLVEEAGDLQLQLGDKTKQLVSVNQLLAERDDLLNSQKNTIWQHESTIAQLRLQIAALTDDLSKANSAVNSLSISLQDASNNLDQVRLNFAASNGRLLGDIDEQQKRLLARDAEVKELKTKLNESISNRRLLTEQSQQLEALQKDASGQANKLKSEVNEKTKCLSAKEVEITNLKSALASLTEQLQLEKQRSFMFEDKYNKEKKAYEKFAAESKGVGAVRKDIIETQGRQIEALKQELRRLRAGASPQQKSPTEEASSPNKASNILSVNIASGQPFVVDQQASDQLRSMIATLVSDVARWTDRARQLTDELEQLRKDNETKVDKLHGDINQQLTRLERSTTFDLAEGRKFLANILVEISSSKS